MMSSSVRDLTESEFLGRRDLQNNPLPPRFPTISSKMSSSVSVGPTAATEDWRHRNTLSAASLLGASCRGTMILAGHGAELQRHAYEFGKHLALASQVLKL